MTELTFQVAIRTNLHGSETWRVGLAFGVNDFDETLPGPFEWDVKRLVGASGWRDAIADVGQLWDEKGSAPVDVMDPVALAGYGELCGWALARAHALSGDPIAIGSYLGSGDKFDRTMTAFAERYADQNECDYQALRGAGDAGRVQVKTGL